MMARTPGNVPRNTPVACAAGILALVVCSPSTGRADLESDLRSLAPQGWRNLAEKSFHLEGKLMVTSNNLGKDGLPAQDVPGNVREIAFKYSPDGFVNIATRKLDGGTTRTSAHVVNPQFAFDLELLPDSKQWMLESLTKSGANDYRRLVRETGFLRLLEAQWSLLGTPLEALIAEKGFNLQSIAAVQDRPNLIQVDFDCQEPKAAGFGPLTVNSIAGTMVLDRDHSWCLTTYDVHVDTTIGEKKRSFKMWAQGEVHYDLRGQEALPQRAIFKRRNPDGKEGSETVFEVAKLARRTIDPNELTLSAFNLQRISEEKSSGHWLWLTLASTLAIVLLLTVLVLHRLRSRGPQSQT